MTYLHLLELLIRPLVHGNGAHERNVHTKTCVPRQRGVLVERHARLTAVDTRALEADERAVGYAGPLRGGSVAVDADCMSVHVGHWVGHLARVDAQRDDRDERRLLPQSRTLVFARAHECQELFLLVVFGHAVGCRSQCGRRWEWKGWKERGCHREHDKRRGEPVPRDMAPLNPFNSPRRSS